MKFKMIFPIFINAVLISCNSDDNANNLQENSDVIRVQDNLFLNAPNDDFEIIDASITDNNLNLTIVYGGGCGNIYYDLLTEHDYLDTTLIEKNIRLAFDDKDNCEAALELKLSFNLTQIQAPNTNKIILNLSKWAEQIEYSY